MQARLHCMLEKSRTRDGRSGVNRLSLSSMTAYRSLPNIGHGPVAKVNLHKCGIKTYR
jgi:hypothetical protein